MTTPTKRSIEQIVELDASVADVWKALTEAEELSRWFPARASVEPGVGGKMIHTWDDEMSFESAITEWDEPRYLRTLWCPADTPEDEQFGVDFWIESKEGKTVLRLVHFGFGEGDDWDARYDGVNRGWDFQLASLQRYLGLHKGQPRSTVYLRWALDGLETPAVWSRVIRQWLGSEALLSPTVGSQHTTQLSSGQTFEGSVRRFIPNKDLQLLLGNWNDAMFRIQTDPCGGGNDLLSIFFAAYGLDDDRVAVLRQGWSDAVASVIDELRD